MNTVLVVLAVLGIGAIMISAYVFAVAARRYVTEDTNSSSATPTNIDMERLQVVRASEDRRRPAGDVVTFPLTLDGVVIERDRRELSDRRAAG